jgi:hypothetical protein
MTIQHDLARVCSNAGKVSLQMHCSKPKQLFVNLQRTKLIVMLRHDLAHLPVVPVLR